MMMMKQAFTLLFLAAIVQAAPTPPTNDNPFQDAVHSSYATSSPDSATPATLTRPPSVGLVTFSEPSYHGDRSGSCPSGTLQTTLAPNNAAYTYTYLNNAMTTSVDSVRDGDLSPMTCNAAVDVTYPAGYQFAISATTFKGYLSLEMDVNGAVRNRYRFQSGAWAWMKVAFDDGQVDHDYTEEARVPDTRLAWSSCSGHERIVTQAKAWLMDVGGMTTGGGALNATQSDGTVSQTAALVWRKC